MVLATVMPGGNVSAKSKKMKMPVKITCYEKDSEGEWNKKTVYHLKYNKKGDVTRVWEEDGYSIKVSYVYKKGKKSKASINALNVVTHMCFDSKGRIKSVDDKIYKYGKKGELKSIKYWSVDDDYVNSPRYYSTTFKKGKKVKQTVKQDGFVNMIRNFNSKGLLTKKITYNGFETKCSYKYKMKGKYVKKLYQLCDGFQTCRVYSYGKSTAKASRYYKIINQDERTIIGHIMEYTFDEIEDEDDGDEDE